MSVRKREEIQALPRQIAIIKLVITALYTDIRRIAIFVAQQNLKVGVRI